MGAAAAVGTEHHQQAAMSFSRQAHVAAAVGRCVRIISAMIPFDRMVADLAAAEGSLKDLAQDLAEIRQLVG